MLDRSRAAPRLHQVAMNLIWREKESTSTQNDQSSFQLDESRTIPTLGTVNESGGELNDSASNHECG